MSKNVPRNSVAILILLLVFAGVTGCVRAIRSDNVRELVEREKEGLRRVNQALRDLEKKIYDAVRDLKTSHRLYLENIRLWEKELKSSQICLASPDEMHNSLVQQLVLMQLVQLEIDRNSAYANLQRDFETQADTLKEAYRKILIAADKVEEQLELINTYVHKSALAFTLESIDVATIREALKAFEEGSLLLQKAAKAGESIEKATGYARVADRNTHMGELIETLSLISSKLQELKRP